MSDSAPPGWFDILRGDLRDMRTEFNGRLDKLVTQDAFAAEQRRVDDKFASLGSDLVEEREARIAAESALTSKIEGVADTAEAAAKSAASRRSWWFRSIVIAAFTAVVGGVVTVVVLLFQQYAHLTGGAP